MALGAGAVAVTPPVVLTSVIPVITAPGEPSQPCSVAQQPYSPSVPRKQYGCDECSQIVESSGQQLGPDTPCSAQERKPEVALGVEALVRVLEASRVVVDALVGCGVAKEDVVPGFALAVPAEKSMLVFVSWS